MSRKLALTTIAAACALCFALVGCGGGAASSNTESSETPADEVTSAAPAEATPSEESSPAAEAPSSAAAESDNHASYFVGQWDLYATEDATHEQVVELMEKYANDEEVHAQMNEAYGRDNVEFCARFNADGTGEIDTGAELVPFTWEATNEGAVTFTSFNGKETAMHLPVTDDMFTLNGDTYAKVS